MVHNHHKPAQISGAFKVELERELTRLRAEVQPAIAERLRLAREGGDATDNAAFEGAKEELARVMARAADIERILREATIIQHKGNAARSNVELGSVVTVCTEEGATRTFTIVASLEASTRDSKVSDESPIGRALVGRKRGDKVLVQAPARRTTYIITEIH